MFTADGDLDLENQDHLKYVILKITIRSPKQRDLEDQDQITILILRSRSDLEDQDHAHLCILLTSTHFYVMYPASAEPCFFLTKRGVKK